MSREGNTRFVTPFELCIAPVHKGAEGEKDLSCFCFGNCTVNVRRGTVNIHVVVRERTPTWGAGERDSIDPWSVLPGQGQRVYNVSGIIEKKRKGRKYQKDTYL